MKKHIQPLFFLFIVVVLIAAYSGCKKNVDKLPPRSNVEKVSLNFGNTISAASFLIENNGEKNLSYSINEDITWLELSSFSGTIGSKSSQEVIVTVSRTGLTQNRYEGALIIQTNDKNHTIMVYMTVDMFLVTVINPVFTTINIEVDSTLNKETSGTYIRKIGINDSTQFSFFGKPDLFSFFAQTYGVYTDSTQLGVEMKWEEVVIVENDTIPRIFLNVSSTYFFLSIINNFETLSPLYVNAGNAFEIVENIFIFQSSDPLPVGYYHALENTAIRAMYYGGTESVTWTQGAQYTFPYTDNQSVTISNYQPDTSKRMTYRHKTPVVQQSFYLDHSFGNVTDIYSKN